MIKVSVITVCYNAEHCIERAIKSALSQSYSPIEYIIVNGGSTDKTSEIISRYRTNISAVICEKDNGIYDAMNKGIKNATGDIIYFLNADDTFAGPDVILKVVSVFGQDSFYPIVCGYVNLTGTPGEQLNMPTYQSPIRDMRTFFCHGICQQRLFVKKDVFKQLGYFNTDYKIVGDFEWFLRVYKSDTRIKFIDHVVANYNLQGSSSQYRNRRIWERRRVAWKNLNPLQWLWFFDRFNPRFMKRPL